MINENWAVVGGIIGLFGAIPYLIGTLKGTTQPNKVTWILWAIVPAIIAIAELDEGVGIRTATTFSASIASLAIFGAALVNKNAYWKLDRVDYFCGAMSILAIALWLVTQDGNIAIFLMVTADGLALIPTLRKSFLDPDSETALTFTAGIVNGGLGLLSISVWSFANYAFPLYLFLSTTLLVAVIKQRRYVLAKQA